MCVVGGEGETTFPNAVFMFESNVDYDCELLLCVPASCVQAAALTTTLLSPLSSSPPLLLLS